ncbi:hypothetical protein CUR178_05604 [Leishmania enriettii]|uniref:Uncharacterized protein n=1 Tax=Leishmania enriettii TaxID=5663 RepID=A0A836KTR6_LEIEN|nr:hypothetical protein CUR178_05604 [Leishmania enriettii]
MPLKQKEEVCGKPNQYNLETLEYDWKELPNTHFQIPPQQPRVRDACALRGHDATSRRLNPITHQPLPFPGCGSRSSRAVSPTPLPSPSRPAQEGMRLRSSPQLQSGNRDHVAELLSGGGGSARLTPSHEPQHLARAPLFVEEDSPQIPLDRYPLSGTCQQVPLLPYAGVFGAGGTPQRNAPTAPSQARDTDAFNFAWSHEDMRRVGQTNSVEAQRSYLR